MELTSEEKSTLQALEGQQVFFDVLVMAEPTVSSSIFMAHEINTSGTITAIDQEAQTMTVKIGGETYEEVALTSLGDRLLGHLLGGEFEKRTQSRDKAAELDTDLGISTTERAREGRLIRNQRAHHGFTKEEKILSDRGTQEVAKALGGGDTLWMMFHLDGLDFFDMSETSTSKGEVLGHLANLDGLLPKKLAGVPHKLIHLGNGEFMLGVSEEGGEAYLKAVREELVFLREAVVNVQDKQSLDSLREAEIVYTLEKIISELRHQYRITCETEAQVLSTEGYEAFLGSRLSRELPQEIASLSPALRTAFLAKEVAREQLQEEERPIEGVLSISSAVIQVKNGLTPERMAAVIEQGRHTLEQGDAGTDPVPLELQEASHRKIEPLRKTEDREYLLEGLRAAVADRIGHLGGTGLIMLHTLREYAKGDASLQRLIAEADNGISIQLLRESVSDDKTLTDMLGDLNDAVVAKEVSALLALYARYEKQILVNKMTDVDNLGVVNFTRGPRESVRSVLELSQETPHALVSIEIPGLAGVNPDRVEQLFSALVQKAEDCFRLAPIIRTRETSCVVVIDQQDLDPQAVERFKLQADQVLREILKPELPWVEMNLAAETAFDSQFPGRSRGVVLGDPVVGADVHVRQNISLHPDQALVEAIKTKK